MLDPRTKLLSVMALVIAVFFIDKIQVYVSLILILFAFRLIMLNVFNIQFVFKIRQIASILFLAAFIILIQTCFGGGFLLGLTITCRIISLILIFPMLTKTTQPYKLAAALNAMGFQYRIAFIFTTAFNQIPHFTEQARVIMDAQKLRGVSAFDNVNIIKKINAYANICFPLVLGAMRKSQITSLAMDSRAFGVYKTRNWIEKPKIKKTDCLMLFGCIMFVVLLLLFNNADFNF